MQTWDKRVIFVYVNYGLQVRNYIFAKKIYTFSNVCIESFFSETSTNKFGFVENLNVEVNLWSRRNMAAKRIS